jgi:hypothetical protein
MKVVSQGADYCWPSASAKILFIKVQQVNWGKKSLQNQGFLELPLYAVLMIDSIITSGFVSLEDVDTARTTYEEEHSTGS